MIYIDKESCISIIDLFYARFNTNMNLMYNYSVHIQGHKIYTLHHLKTFVQPTWEDQYPLQVAYCNGTINNESYFFPFMTEYCVSKAPQKVYWIVPTSLFISFAWLP